MLTLRNVRSDDAATQGRVRTFLANNPDPGVRARPDELVDAALKSGQAIIVEDREQIVGCSLIYKFAVGRPVIVFSEIGTMRITLNGLGLQRLIADIHLLHLSREEDINANPSVFAIVSPGSASEHNLRKVGMFPWQVPRDLANVRNASGVPIRTDKLILAAGASAVADAIAELRTLHRGGRNFATPKGGEVVIVQVGWFDPYLLRGP